MTLATKYSLDSSELFAIWESGEVKDNVEEKQVEKKAKAKKSPVKKSPVEKKSPVKKPLEKSEKSDEITKDNVMKATKELLVAMCRAKGLTVSGKKEDLVKRLLASLDGTTAPPPSASKLSSKTKSEQVPPVLKNIIKKQETPQIRKNSHGNFEHLETGIVFNSEKMAIGKQMDDGVVEPLTTELIEVCKKYKFAFKVPDNLNTKNFDDVRVEEIDDDVNEDEEDFVEEEVEEEVEDDGGNDDE
jgi:hypothetical protein